MGGSANTYGNGRPYDQYVADDHNGWDYLNNSKVGHWGAPCAGSGCPHCRKLKEWQALGAIVPKPPTTVDFMGMTFTMDHEAKQAYLHTRTEGHVPDCECPKCEPGRW